MGSDVSIMNKKKHRTSLSLSEINLISINETVDIECHITYLYSQLNTLFCRNRVLRCFVLSICKNSLSL